MEFSKMRFEDEAMSVVRFGQVGVVVTKILQFLSCPGRV